MSTEPTYVWSRNGKRHHALGPPDPGRHLSRAACSPTTFGVTRDAAAVDLLRWGDAANATAALVRVDAMPACRRCERSWANTQESSR